MYVGDIARQYPNRVAVTFTPSGQERTYRELDQNSLKLAAFLRERGIGPGEHIAIVATNGPFFLEAALAAHRSGLQYTTINTHFRAEDIAYVLQDSGSRAVLVGDGMQGLIDHAANSVEVRVDEHHAVAGGFSHADVLARDMSDGFEEVSGSPMLYSSGTTGRPKGIEFPLSGAHPRQLDAFTANFVELFGINDQTVMLLPGPFYHTSPQFYANMVLRVGGRLVVMEKFDAEQTLRIIEAEGVTHSFFVPTMLIRMLRLPDEVREAHDLSSHVFSLHGAGPCPPEVKEKLVEWWGPILWEGYAGSERNGMTILAPEDGPEHRGSVGRPVGCEIVIAEDGRRVAVGETGVVYFAGGYEFAYFGDPVKTAGAYLEPGVSTLGDIGHLDEDGFLYLTDRVANVIITGGVNIYPQEVESLLALHPDIEDLAVIGVPDQDLGEIATAVVQLVPGRPADDAMERSILEYCRARLATYTCPRRVVFVDEIPRQPTGKLMKRMLRGIVGDRLPGGDENAVRT